MAIWLGRSPAGRGVGGRKTLPPECGLIGFRPRVDRFWERLYPGGSISSNFGRLLGAFRAPFFTFLKHFFLAWFSDTQKIQLGIEKWQPRGMRRATGGLWCDKLCSEFCSRSHMLLPASRGRQIETPRWGGHRRPIWSPAILRCPSVFFRGVLAALFVFSPWGSQNEAQRLRNNKK